MKIPPNITKEHILRAIDEIDSEKFPIKRDSTGYNLIFKNKKYPPKYVICIANKYANGEELNGKIFTGGPIANDFLKKRGFHIEKKVIKSKTNVWFVSPNPPASPTERPEPLQHPSEYNSVFEKMMGDGYFSLGWKDSPSKNMKSYKQNELTKLFEELKKNEKWTDQRIEYHYFIKDEMKEGDLIVAKKGSTKNVYGIGIISSEYDYNNEFDTWNSTCNHYVGVNWIINFYETFRFESSNDFYFVDLEGLSEIYAINNFQQDTVLKKNLSDYFLVKQALKKKLEEYLNKEKISKEDFNIYLDKFKEIEDLIFFRYKNKNYWIFQSNPSTFNLEDAIEAFDFDTFTIRQQHFKDKIKIGDCVLFWISEEKDGRKRKSGIVGYGNILSLPENIKSNSRADKYLIEGSSEEKDLRVWVSYNKINTKILREQILKFPDEIKNEMKILKMANQTNYNINKKVWDFIMDFAGMRKKKEGLDKDIIGNAILSFLKKNMNVY